MRTYQHAMFTAVTEINRLSAGSKNRLVRIVSTESLIRLSVESDGIIAALDIPAIHTGGLDLNAVLHGPTFAAVLATYAPESLYIETDTVNRTQKRAADEFIDVELPAIKISQGESFSRLIAQTNNEIQAMPDGQPVATIDSSNFAAFKTAAKFAVEFAAREDNRPILTGIRIRNEQNALQFTAADGFMLAMSTAPLANPVNECNMLIPVKRFEALLRVTEKLDRFDILETEDHGIILKTLDCSFYIPGIEGNYPPIEHLFLTDTFSYQIDVAQWVKPLKSLKKYQHADGVTLSSTDQGLTLFSSSNEHGYTEVEVSTLTTTYELRNFAAQYKYALLMTGIAALVSAYTSHPQHSVKQGRKTVKLTECAIEIQWNPRDTTEKPMQFAATVYGVSLKLLLMPMYDREKKLTPAEILDQKINAEYLQQGIEHGIAQHDYNAWVANTLPGLIEQRAIANIAAHYHLNATPLLTAVHDYRDATRFATWNQSDRNLVTRLIDRLCNGPQSAVAPKPRQKLHSGPYQRPKR